MTIRSGQTNSRTGSTSGLSACVEGALRSSLSGSASCAFSSAIAAAESVNAAALSGLSPEERDQFLHLMTKIIRTFDEGEEHGAGPEGEETRQA